MYNRSMDEYTVINSNATSSSSPNPASTNAPIHQHAIQLAPTRQARRPTRDFKSQIARKPLFPQAAVLASTRHHLLFTMDVFWTLPPVTR
jgi:hypothetical protein